MTLEAQLLAILAAVAPGHVFNTSGADAETGDHIIFQRITTTTVLALQGEAGIENARFQIDCYSQTAVGASALVDSVKAAMQVAALVNNRFNQIAGYEDGVELYRTTLEFSVWG